MHQLLAQLGPEQLALDLGCGAGSLSYARCSCRIVAVDLRAPQQIPRPARGGFVQADAARLPLADACCDLVIANHTFEHISHWRGALREVARVLKAEGQAVVTVPDGHCLSDALFRFLDKGREHVNRFQREEFMAAVEQETGLRPTRWRALYSSYSFLNRRPGQRFGGRARVLNWAPAPLLRAGLLAWNALAHAADHRLGWRWSTYGWLFHFTRHTQDPAEQEAAQPNVCVQCGSGHDAAWLRQSGCVYGRVLRRYDCPTCGARNLFFSE